MSRRMWTLTVSLRTLPVDAGRRLPNSSGIGARAGNTFRRPRQGTPPKTNPVNSPDDGTNRKSFGSRLRRTELRQRDGRGRCANSGVPATGEEARCASRACEGCHRGSARGAGLSACVMSAISGAYSGASRPAKTAAHWPGCATRRHFTAAGYTVDYADGRAAMALHPADGKPASFVSTGGSVENFVLWNYGIADRDKLSENPRLSSNFYGGLRFYIGHHTADPDARVAEIRSPHRHRN